MSKIAKVGYYYKASRTNHTTNTPVFGLEWEIPFTGSDVNVWDMNFQESCARNFPNHMANHVDSGCIEVKTPIGDLGQQKRWVKSMIRVVKHINKDIKGVLNGGGIHVHLSTPKFMQHHCLRPRTLQNMQPSYVFQDFVYDLVQQMNTKYRPTFWADVTHRCSDEGYYQNATQKIYIERVQNTANQNMLHVELRSFNSHPALLLPALEFQHAFYQQSLKADRLRNKLSNFETTLRTNKKYRHAWELYFETVKKDNGMLITNNEDISPATLTTRLSAYV